MDTPPPHIIGLISPCVCLCMCKTSVETFNFMIDIFDDAMHMPHFDTLLTDDDDDDDDGQSFKDYKTLIAERT